jgi:hypothetical protein
VSITGGKIDMLNLVTYLTQTQMLSGMWLGVASRIYTINTCSKKR